MTNSSANHTLQFSKHPYTSQVAFTHVQKLSIKSKLPCITGCYKLLNTLYRLLTILNSSHHQWR